MANLSHKAVVAAFEKRYDYQSARNVLDLALAAGGLSAKDAYSDAEAGKIADALKALGERESEVVAEALAGGDGGGGAAPADDKKADAKKDDKKADAKKDDKKADKKADAKKKK